jgi:predicted hydrocarbon binding protein
MPQAHDAAQPADRLLDPARRAQLVIAPASLHALHRALAEAQGAAAAAATLQAAGYTTGQAHAAALQEWLAARGDGEVASLALGPFEDRLAAFFRELGWGELSLRTSGPVSVVATRGWAEWQPREEGEPPACHFTTGMLAGLFGALAGHPLAVLEVEPADEQAEGAGRFLIGNEATLNDLFDRLQHGESADAALAAIR